jgi:hypothetical protein
MAGSITPGPSAGGRTRRLHARFWLLVAVGSICMRGGYYGMPGWDNSGSGVTRCPKCNAEALEVESGIYVCDNDHQFFAEVEDQGEE